MGSSSPNFRGENKTNMYFNHQPVVDGVTSQVAAFLMGAGCNFWCATHPGIHILPPQALGKSGSPQAKNACFFICKKS